MAHEEDGHYLGNMWLVLIGNYLNFLFLRVFIIGLRFILIIIILLVDQTVFGGRIRRIHLSQFQDVLFEATLRIFFAALNSCRLLFP